MEYFWCGPIAVDVSKPITIEVVRMAGPPDPKYDLYLNGVWCKYDTLEVVESIAAGARKARADYLKSIH
jgi:hypothetical protein